MSVWCSFEKKNRGATVLQGDGVREQCAIGDKFWGSKNLAKLNIAAMRFPRCLPGFMSATNLLPLLRRSEASANPIPQRPTPRAGRRTPRLQVGMLAGRVGCVVVVVASGKD